jgi:hypothetical protein
MSDVTEENTLLLPLLYKHAWNYFKLHANQRIVLFRLYIIFISLFTYGVSFLLVHLPEKKPLYECAGFILSTAFIILTVIFHFLDHRNRKLIHFSEDALRDLESDFTREKLKIFTIEKNKKSCIRHTHCFTAIFICGYLASIFLLSSEITAHIM